MQRTGRTAEDKMKIDTTMTIRAEKEEEKKIKGQPSMLKSKTLFQMILKTREVREDQSKNPKMVVGQPSFRRV